MNPSSRNNHNSPAPPTLLQVIGSAVAAAFGVQSSKNQSRDFQGGSPWMFIAVGIAFTLLFVLGLKALVSLAMSQ
jgi:hypothetical protein